MAKPEARADSSQAFGETSDDGTAAHAHTLEARPVRHDLSTVAGEAPRTLLDPRRSAAPPPP